MRVNKFSMPWQIIRVKAKKQKDVSKKISLVTQFLTDTPTYENMVRVLNWAKMTKVAYRDAETKQRFDILIDYIEGEDWKEHEPAVEGPEGYSLEDIEMVMKDLSKRKNDFMHGGVAPKDQVEFMAKLEAELEKRK